MFKKPEPFFPKQLAFDEIPQKVCIIVSDPNSHILESFYKYELNWEYYEKYKENSGTAKLPTDKEDIFFNFHAYYFLIRDGIKAAKTAANERPFQNNFPTEKELEEYINSNWEGQMRKMKLWKEDQEIFARMMKRNPLHPRWYYHQREIET